MDEERRGPRSSLGEHVHGGKKKTEQEQPGTRQEHLGVGLTEAAQSISNVEALATHFHLRRLCSFWAGAGSSQAGISDFITLLFGASERVKKTQFARL